MTETAAFEDGLAADHHLLLLPGDIDPDELEALAVSRSADAGWAAPGQLQLLSGVHLTGPWSVSAGVRTGLDLPEWTEQAYLLLCPPQRGGPLPAELRGMDPVLDAFPQGVPEGAEATALEHLRAFARRLHGALRLAGTGAVVVPDPDSALDLTVLAPVWLEHDACLQVLAGVLPSVRSLLDEIPEELAENELEGYALVTDVGGGDLVVVDVTGLQHPPTVLRGTDWALGGVVSYEIRWRPTRPELAYVTRPTLAVRQARAEAAAVIERAAAALHGTVGGEVCDDDGFLVAPEDLAG
ncbi:hypothetical protein [Georgenia sp. SYP-B2076]|uniref:hypothetical protein n=1 Tax=Georgenia sp. SYP-B2076 TaxID=2495881 RepID=UPI000F8EAB86|nr:hypothetical protein [Georgenia sp. SYP-B2076]